MIAGAEMYVVHTRITGMEFCIGKVPRIGEKATG